MILTTILKFLHLLSTVMWIGGMLTINLVLMPSLAAIDPPQRGKMLGASLKRYMPLALGAMILLLLTGIQSTPSEDFFNLSTFIGIIFALKHLVVIIMVIIGLMVPFVLSPKMQKLSPAPGTPPSPAFIQTQKQLSLLSLVNMVLGIIVLFLAAMIK